MAKPKPEIPAVQVHLYLPRELANRLKAHAAARGVKITKDAEVLLTKALDAEEAEEAAAA